MKIGNASMRIARSADQFDRKPMAEITDSPALQALFEPVRLAPSARNSQPWFFTREEQAVHVWRIPATGILKKHMTPMNQIDVGIALCHAALALEHVGQPFAAAVQNPAPARAGVEYVLTLTV